jgi:iron complex outermembrane receptor protein
MKSLNFSFLKILLIFSIAVPVQAQSVLLEEITVTAQKREQDLQDVAISITAFSGEQLRQLGFTSTDTFDEQVPGLMVTSYGSGVTTIFNIRGSQQLDFADQQEPPVAVYVDGSYNSYLAGVGFNFFDLDRIEVLRGPQGTLFGRNATGGVVHLVSKKPSQETEGYVEAGGGEYGKYIVEAAIGGGLSETVSGRVSLYREKNNGYTEELTPGVGDHNQTDNWSSRAQLLFEPNDDLSILINGRYSTDDVNGGIYNINQSLVDVGGLTGLPGDGAIQDGTNLQHFEFCTGAPATVGVLSFAPVSGATNCFGYFEDTDPQTATSNTPGFYNRDHYGVTGTITWDTGMGEVTSITDWQDFKKRYLEDTDSSPLQLFDFFQDMDSNQFSQELRLRGESSRMKWTVGAYYLNIDSSYRVGVDGAGTGVNVDPATGAPIGPLDQDSFGAIGISLDNRYTLDTTTYALFGQVEYDLTDQFTLSAGLRYTHDEKDMEVTPMCGFAPGLADVSNGICQFLASLGPFSAGGFGDIVQGLGLTATRKEEDWSGHVEVNYRPNDDWLLYAKIVRGHKAGGFNSGGTLFFTPAQAVYDSELPISYEAGFKSTFWDGRARLNASGFYIDYKDFQTFTQLGLSLLLFNVDAEVTGAEFELALNPAEGWDVLFGLSLLDAEQKGVDGPGGVINRPMPNSPDVSINGLVRYEWPMLNGMVAAQVDGQYVDGRSLNGINHPSLVDTDYTIFNASMGWRSEDERWEAKIYVKNLTDEYYIPTVFDLAAISGNNIEQAPAPRWFGGSVRYNFF